MALLILRYHKTDNSYYALYGEQRGQIIIFNQITNSTIVLVV